MSCYHPIKAWIVTHLDGKRHISFRDPTIAAAARHSSVVETSLPCGRCMGCRIKKAVEWTLRLKHEASQHSENCFITLTYNDEHLPIINGVPSLPLYTFDFQPFLKRLRKNTGKRIRFFMCSEYGSKTERPHYHALLFGYCPHDLVRWSHEDGHWLYRSKELEDAWSDLDPLGSGQKTPIGFVTVGQLCDETVRYVARYTLKKLDGVMSTVWLGSRQPDYIRMSLKPGIGAEWLDRFHRDVYKVDLMDGQVYKDSVTLDGAREVKPPRYYDKLMAGGGGGAREARLARSREARRARLGARLCARLRSSVFVKPVPIGRVASRRLTPRSSNAVKRTRSMSPRPTSHSATGIDRTPSNTHISAAAKRLGDNVYLWNLHFLTLRNRISI